MVGKVRLPLKQRSLVRLSFSSSARAEPPKLLGSGTEVSGDQSRDLKIEERCLYSAKMNVPPM